MFNQRTKRAPPGRWRCGRPWGRVGGREIAPCGPLGSPLAAFGTWGALPPHIARAVHRPVGASQGPHGGGVDRGRSQRQPPLAVQRPWRQRIPMHALPGRRASRRHGLAGLRSRHRRPEHLGGQRSACVLGAAGGLRRRGSGMVPLARGTPSSRGSCDACWSNVVRPPLISERRMKRCRRAGYRSNASGFSHDGNSARAPSSGGLQGLKQNSAA
jgi:hypothetical protein